jgi:hypothetical protein
MIRLDLDQRDDQSGIRSRMADLYRRIAGGGNDYERNEKSLGQIQLCVITLSAIATGGVNAFAHHHRIGWVGASVLAILITGFVERFYFALRHGLMTVYKSRGQRFAARLCYRTLQWSMCMNAMILCAWLTGIAMPEFLKLWNDWALAVHFGLALVGVSAVRDKDALATSRIREMQANAAEHDILTIRRAAAGNHPLLLLAARIRGWLDGMELAYNLLRDKPRFSGNYTNEITGSSRNLYLPEGVEDTPPPNKVTDISGKRPRR